MRCLCITAILSARLLNRVINGHSTMSASRLLYPRKRTLAGSHLMSALGNNGLMHRSKMSRYPITSSARMRIVGGTVTPIALAVFEVDKKVKFRGLLNRKIGGVRPFEDLVDERACASVQGRHVQSIGCKHAGFPLLAGKRNGRQLLPVPEGGAFAGDGRHGSIIPSRGAARSRVCRLSLAPAVS